MQKTNPRLLELYERWLNREAGPADMEAFIQLLAEADAAGELPAVMRQVWDNFQAGPVYTPGQKQDIADRILQQYPAAEPAGKGRVTPWHAGWLRYAAAIIILFGLGAYLWLSQKPLRSSLSVKEKPAPDIPPGREGAILTLAGGEKIVLDSLGDGVIAQQNGASVVLGKGMLSYNASGNTAGAPAFNTMTTPRGRQFRVVLPDGTVVWLNAASSLRYPVAFTGQAREVEVSGEAYFEVAKQDHPVTGKRVPFKVKINDHTTVEVLGTRFNVNAYTDEPVISTTLLEGSVRIMAYRKEQAIAPGQQAQVAPQEGTGIRVLNNINVDRVMAWKNGLFNFDGRGLEEVMRQLSRWYDIDVVYEGRPPRMEFGGKMGRNLHLSDVLQMLENSEVHFRMEGKRLVVQP